MRRVVGLAVVAALAFAGTAAASPTAAKRNVTISRVTPSGLQWLIQTSPFRISFRDHGRVLTQEPRPSAPGPGNRLSFQTTSGARYALTDLIRSHRAPGDAMTFTVATSDPGHSASVTLGPVAGGLRVTVTLHPQVHVAYFFESLTAGLGDHFLGTGQRSMFVDLSRQVVPMEVLFQPAWYDSTCGTSAVSVPFFLSNAGYGVHINNTNVGKLAFPGATTKPQTGTILPAGTECPHDQPNLCPIATVPALDRTQICLQSDSISYDVYAGDFDRIEKAYGEQVGYPRMAIPAQFGLQKWRDIVDSGRQLVSDVKALRRRGIPVSSVAIDNPWELAAPRRTGTAGLTSSCVGTLRFDPKRFPHPRRLVAQLHRMGTKVILWVAPFYFDPAKTGCPKPPYPPNGFVRGRNIYTFPPPADQFSQAAPYDLDLTNPATVREFSKRLTRVFRVGVDGVKGDRGDETDFLGSTFHAGAGRRLQNRYPLIYARIVMKALAAALRREGRDPHRVMTQWRAGSSGSASEVPAIWTADQTMDSTGFQSAVRMVLTAGPSGFPVTGPDIGGYLGLFTDQVGLGDTPAQTADKLPTASLFIRWAQLGAISPFMEVAAPGPNNATQFWKRWGPEVTARFRNMAVLHYELFPEFWNRERDAHLTGAPIVRPLGYAYPDDATAWQQQQEGMLGDNLLFAMVSSNADFLTDEMFGKSLASVYLPKGHWVDVFRRTPVAGGRTMLRATTLEDFPLYLKAGAAVPFNSRAPIWADPWGLQQLQSKRRFGYLWAPTSRWTVNGGLSGRYRDGVAEIDLRGRVRHGSQYCVVIVTNQVPRRVVVNGEVVPKAGSAKALRGRRQGWTVYRPPAGQVGGIVVKASVEG